VAQTQIENLPNAREGRPYFEAAAAAGRDERPAAGRGSSICQGARNTRLGCVAISPLVSQEVAQGGGGPKNKIAPLAFFAFYGHFFIVSTKGAAALA
jgi:hypothetical protein